MRAVIQRVTQASVEIHGVQTAAIQAGLLIFLGIEPEDAPDDIEWLSRKIVQLRIFDDATGIPNHSIQEVNADLLLVSQFTLHASTKKGNRPSYIRAARPDVAVPLYESMIRQLEKDLGKPIQTGTFGAHMNVSLINDGPVTIWIDTKAKE
ncbi:MAG: D-aminoacyl-tRNA deacylase [Ferruginibacter sp.]